MRRIALLLCWAALVAGCSRSEPTLTPVQGRVFHRGQPLPGGTIVFTPDVSRGGRGPQAWAEIDSEGRFSLKTDGRHGAAPGWHRITIAPLGEYRLPSRYRDPDQSGQRVEVKSDRSSPYDLHLE
jgi:hypothetical protein